MPVGGGDYRRWLRRTDGAKSAAAGAHGGVQEEAGGAGPQSDLARVRHRMADADCEAGIRLDVVTVASLVFAAPSKSSSSRYQVQSSRLRLRPTGLNSLRAL